MQINLMQSSSYYKSINQCFFLYHSKVTLGSESFMIFHLRDPQNLRCYTKMSPSASISTSLSCRFKHPISVSASTGSGGLKKSRYFHVATTPKKDETHQVNIRYKLFHGTSWKSLGNTNYSRRNFL